MPRITNVQEATQAGAYDAQNGQGAYSKLPAPVTPMGNTATQVTKNPISAPVLKADTGTYTPPTGNTPLNTTASIDATIASGTAGQNKEVTTTSGDTTTTISKEEPSRLKYLQESTMNLLGLQRNAPAMKQDLREQARLEQKERKKDRLYNEMTARKKSYEDQIDGIVETPTGTPLVILERQQNDLRRKANSELADLAIQYNVANGDYQAAERLVNEQIQDINDSYKLEIDIAKTAMDFLRNDMTQSEILQAEQQNRMKEEERANEEYRLRAKFAQELEQADPMYAAQLSHLRAQTGKIYSDINSAKSSASAIQQLDTLVSQKTPEGTKAALSSILGSNSITAGTKGRIAPAVEVLTAVEELANQNQEGKFTGVGLFGRMKEGVKGWFNAKNTEATNNAQAINAINLKTQQWASGAALTEAQTKQVEKFTPNLNDSDKQVRAKVNGLYNFMLKQAEGNLLTEGVNVSFPTVNLFEVYDLYEKASPEQKALIEQQYFNK